MAKPDGLGALVVEAVEPGGPADRAGVRAGDVLRAVDDRPVLDILDFRFLTATRRPRLALEREGQPFAAALGLTTGEDPGIAFRDDLGDDIHTCNNRCVFCFIHQMPKRLRRSLYLMDDDFRMSFMHGNYITLTNLTDAEWRRILDQRLSPLYVSVHATDPAIRGRMLGKREAAPILPQLRELAEGRIDVHAQIVLCPGWNDGAVLDQTLADLAREHPAASGRRCGVQSVAVVPVGLTQFRERLTRLDPADAAYAAGMIGTLRRRGAALEREIGTRFAWLSDEWYYLAGKPVPGARHYEDFPQLEDGVGTSRLFLEDLRRLERRLPPIAPQPVRVTLVTAEIAADLVQRLAARLCAVQGVEANVCVVQNRFFGGGIDIAGLLTGQDIAEQVQAFGAHDHLALPDICLRDRSTFLDDWTTADVERATGRQLLVTGKRPTDLAADLGLIPAPRG